MAKQARTIQNQLRNLVEMRIWQRGCDSLMEFQRKFPDRELFDAPLCPLINPGCPDDLCYLPAGHVGTEEGFHITGTTAYDSAIKWVHGELAPVGTSRSELIRHGAVLAKVLWPDD